MATTTVKISVDRTPVNKSIEFFSDRKKIVDRTKNHFENPAAKAEVLKTGRQIVQNFVYDAYEPKKYKRTYNLLNSVSVATDTEKAAMGSLSLYSDPLVAGAEVGDTIGKSYAAFFIKPAEYKTFIKPRGVASAPINYRPFFILWENYLQRFVLPHASESLRRAILDVMPNEIK